MKKQIKTVIVFFAIMFLCSCSISEIEPIEQPTEKEEIESQSDVGGPQKAMAQSTNTDSLNFDQIIV